jgi:predicted phage terminase large subunit-like protein
MDEMTRKILREDFAAFLQKCFEILNPGTLFEDNWHLHAMAQTLKNVLAGKTRRQIITMPPRQLKSTTVSVAWVAYLLGLNPAVRIIVVSYSEKLAATLSQDTRRIMESSDYQKVFPKTELVKNTTLQLETTSGGGRFATSVGGATTGFGADWIIVDDPHNAAEVYWASARATAKTYFDKSLSSRLNNPRTGKIILVMQRLHADDLAGHLLARGGWDELKLQARATVAATIDTGCGSPHVVAEGDLMDPQRLPDDVLDDLQRQMGSIAFQAQYQQEPVPDAGNMVRKEWLKYYDTAPSRENGRVVLSLDTATKTDPANDYSACTVWLERDGMHYVMDVWRDKVTYPDLKRKVIDLVNVHRAHEILIEDQGSGSALIQDLVREGLPAVGRKTRDSKESRLASASAYIAAGQCWLPKDAHWLAAFETELLGFPAVRHDDQVDTLSQYFAWVREKPKALFNVFWP